MKREIVLPVKILGVLPVSMKTLAIPVDNNKSDEEFLRDLRDSGVWFPVTFTATSGGPSTCNGRITEYGLLLEGE